MIGIYGAAGCGRGIMPVARVNFPEDELVFIDDGACPDSVNGYPCMSRKKFLASDPKGVILAIADGHIRARLNAQLGLPLIGVQADNAVLMDEVELASGACLSPFACITSNVKIGLCLHANLYSYIEHDCVIGDFVTLGPGAKVNGNVKVEDFAYIGAGAVVRQGLTIGKGAIVGMGAVVTKDVLPGQTVIGNPARPMAEKT